MAGGIVVLSIYGNDANTQSSNTTYLAKVVLQKLKKSVYFMCPPLDGVDYSKAEYTKQLSTNKTTRKTILNAFILEACKFISISKVTERLSPHDDVCCQNADTNIQVLFLLCH